MSDADKAATAAYGIGTNDKGNPLRTSVLIAPDGRIAKAYETVVPADHPAEVLADLATLA